MCPGKPGRMVTLGMGIPTVHLILKLALTITLILTKAYKYALEFPVVPGGPAMNS